MLKFENKFSIGQTIKAFDFEPLTDRLDSYIIGLIIDDNNNEHGFKAYKVEIIQHLMGDLEIEYPEEDKVAWIPMEVSFFDYDNRITHA